MASKRSQAKQAKAARRKKMLAGRRLLAPAGASSSSVGRARQAAAAPLHYCLIQDGLFEQGNGTAVVARKTGFGEVTVGIFLLDVFCLGIKDVIFREMAIAEFDEFLDGMSRAIPFSPADLAYVRKLLKELEQYARSLGFAPPADFQAAEILLGDVRAEDCTASFEFGDGGMPHYIPGPSDTPSQIRQRLKRLRAKLGDGGFHFTEAWDGGDDLEEVFGAYDPAVAPDAVEWLDLDEEDRLQLVETYHRRVGFVLPDPKTHATLHTVVENEIAAQEPPAVGQALARLVAEGLDRHQAIHAIAWVLTDQICRAATEHAEFSAGDYLAALENLSEGQWRAATEGDGDD